MRTVKVGVKEAITTAFHWMLSTCQTLCHVLWRFSFLREAISVSVTSEDVEALEGPGSRPDGSSPNAGGGFPNLSPGPVRAAERCVRRQTGPRAHLTVRD